MRTLSFIAAIMLVVTLAVPARAQSADSFVINLRNTEIQVFAEQISDITGRTLILDPAVRGQVTVLSTEPLGRDGVWELFQSVLRSYGFAAVPTGGVWRVVPQAVVGQSARLGGAGGSQDYVTLLIPLDTLPAEEAARVLRPLVAAFGTLQPLTRPNAIIVTDTAETVARISQLAETLDDQPGREVISLRLSHAGAREVAQIVQQILDEEVPGRRPPRIAADERSNTLIIRGRRSDVRDVIDLARSLDTPGGSAPTTRVFRLSNGDAEVVAEILRGLLGATPAPTNPVARAVSPEVSPLDGAAASPAGDIVASGFTAGDVAIQASVELNAVIVRGPPAAIVEIDQLISQLDIRRPQVMIEAAIVEISGDLAEQLGVQFGGGQAAQQGNFGATSFSLTGLALDAILATLGVPASVGIASEGLSVGFGLGNQFSILIQALAQSTRANLLSTPSITTLDNQPAEIVVAQNVPFLTGTFSPSGNSADVFSTIEREDVGIILRVVPRVHEGDTIRLEVSQEVSALVNANVAGASDLITNRRAIQTTVLADNGGTIVLGGLITDDRQSIDSKIPLLGDIPVVGKVFGAEQQSRRKQTLFVFLRPTILRDRASVDGVARRQYERVRQVQNEPLTSSSLLIEDTVETLPLEIEGLY